MIKKPCIRCLISEIDDSVAMKIIEDYKSGTSPEDAADNALYKSRLNTCKSCKYLNFGVCLKCGAYVEARLYRISGKCPMKLM